MEGWYQISLRCNNMSLWTLVVILLMLPHYSESACTSPNCNLSQCNGYTCYGCNNGFYLQSGSCVYCLLSQPGCATCSSSTYCTKCNDGYYLQSGSCQQCPDRCSTCTSSTQCTTCKETYWKRYDGCNSYCTDSCLNRRCNDTTGFCYSCVTGKYGPQCGQNCNLCKDEQCDLRKCTNGCKDGYYQDNVDSGYSYCYKCVSDNCLTCSNGTYCTQCEQGFYRNYYRQEFSGRGRMNCLQCYENCLDCTSTEYCHEDCIQHCGEPVNPGTTNSIDKTTTLSSTTTKLPSTSNNRQISTTTHSVSTQHKPTQPDTMNPTTGISTKHPDKPQTDRTATTHTSNCHYVNGELYKELNSCQQRIKTYSESVDQNQLTFGHGFATGFGVAILLFGSGVGIALFIRRQTKQHKHADENSDGHHEYVNTNMADRPTHESDYTDLKNT